MTGNEMALMASIAVKMQKSEVNDVLDKVRAEIVELWKNEPCAIECGCLDEILQIIDKYKADAEQQESEKINCESTKCENCINHNYCDFEQQESEEA